jgi:hypothetical protein
MIPQIIVRPTVIGPRICRWEIAACVEGIGTFAIDDNQDLADPALSKFVLEVKDLLVPVAQRRFMPNKGWQRITTKECMIILESAGVIDRRQ